MFIGHVLATRDVLPPIGNVLYEFVIAGNGIFIRAKRTGLEAMIPYSNTPIQGLAFVRPYVRMAGRVPEILVHAALGQAWRELPNEILFWFKYQEQKRTWQLVRPAQTNGTARCCPADLYDPQGAEALIDLHSHNTMQPSFSTIDDADETGFRIYAVIGDLPERPAILVRVGIYGHYANIPASWVFAIPAYLTDAREERSGR